MAHIPGERVFRERRDRFIDAAYAGDWKYLQGRIDDGLDINTRHSELGTTALHAAVDHGHRITTKFLLENGADTNAQLPHTDETPLHRAAQRHVKQTVYTNK